MLASATAVVRYSTTTGVPGPAALMARIHQASVPRPAAPWTACGLCGYEKPVGAPCGLPCV